MSGPQCEMTALANVSRLLAVILPTPSLSSLVVLPARKVVWKLMSDKVPRAPMTRHKKEEPTSFGRALVPSYFLVPPVLCFHFLVTRISIPRLACINKHLQKGSTSYNVAEISFGIVLPPCEGVGSDDGHGDARRHLSSVDDGGRYTHGKGDGVWNFDVQGSDDTYHRCRSGKCLDFT